jgi:hypothetical protein
LIIALAEAAEQRNSAIALFLDEVQYLSPQELAALVVACHEVAQRNLPFMFIGAGLPQIAALAGNAKSYAERLFNYPQMGPLEPAAARAPRIASVKMLPDGLVASGEMLPATAPATMVPPLIWRDYGNQDDAHGTG